MKRALLLSVLSCAFLWAKPSYYEGVNRVLDELYSMNYERALLLADSAALKYENRVLGDFLKAGIYSTYMSDFETDTLWDSLKKYSEGVIANHNQSNPYEVFFSGGAYLYRTYYFVWKDDYKNTTLNGIKALNNFNKAVKMDDKLYDAYLGRGIVNYFVDKFKDRVPLLNPTGNGIKEIAMAADSGLFSRVPAMDVLSMLYAMDKMHEKAESISVVLRREFPENRMFMFTHAKNLIEAEKHYEASLELETLRKNIEKNQKKTYVNKAFVYYYLAECYYNTGDRKRCSEYLAKLKKLSFLTSEKKVHKYIKKGDELNKKLGK